MSSVDWRLLARQRFPRAKRIEGEGQYAMILGCRRDLRIRLFPTLGKALYRQQKLKILGCGGRFCHRDHAIRNLALIKAKPRCAP